ncbi:MAG TPA: PA14 domain-containing protein, partial [Candidatus Limnocylindria bacterium]|nr:PA14 domain-containing protein [Candidatus Limnocylindria bacterium]
MCTAGATAFAGSVSYNFDSDPSGILSLFGNATWAPNDGNPATGGYLSLTEAVNSQRSAIVFDDFDNGLVVKAFSFSMDVRIGGGSSTPADGFSVNYLRANDPVLTSGDPLNNWATGPSGDADLPEEGATTGLAIGFDAYDNGGDGSGGVTDDVIGISVRVDNVLIAQYPLGSQNTTCEDLTSLQTGPLDADNPGSPDLLCWQPFSVDLAETGKLVVKYKGKEITPAGGLQTTFIPSPGRLVLVARTGGLNQNQHIDNLAITTVASSVPTVSPINAHPAGFDFTILDAGADKVDSTTVAVTLNGTAVAAAVSKTADTTSVSFSEFPTLNPAGSTNTVVVSYKDNFGNPLSVTREYVQVDYAVVPPALALPAGAVSTATPGFVIKSAETDAGNGNSLALTQDELAGLLGPNLADLSLADANGLFHEPAVINYDKDPGTDGQQGNFGNENLIPGFPGTGPNMYDNAALEATTYLRFPAAGVYTMGVSSDDGFRVTIAKNAGEKLGGVLLGQYNNTGGRGAGVPGTLFTFVVQQAGVYPARLIWENGGGGSSLEWFSVKTNGSYVLVND